jgi:hypothetical protein
MFRTGSHPPFKLKCTKCNKWVFPKHNIVCDLKAEPFAAVGMLCRHCDTPLTKRYTARHHVELPGHIKRRSLNATRQQYIQRYSREWPDLMDEDTAAEYCGYKLNAIRSIFRQQDAPRAHHIGYLVYLKMDLDEWLQRKEDR